MFGFSCHRQGLGGFHFELAYVRIALRVKSLLDTSEKSKPFSYSNLPLIRSEVESISSGMCGSLLELIYDGLARFKGQTDSTKAIKIVERGITFDRLSRAVLHEAVDIEVRILEALVQASKSREEWERLAEQLRSLSKYVMNHPNAQVSEVFHP